VKKSFLCVVVGGLLTSSASANIVVNGSFEDPAITTPLGFVPFYAGSTGITGWTVTAPNASQGVDIVSASLYGNPAWAFAGNQSVELAGTPGRGGVEQALATLPGQGYVLSFALSSQPLSPVTGGVSVFWDGTLIETLTSPGFGTWQTFTYNVVGGPDATSLLAFSGNIDGNFGTLLDDVSVVVPAPGVLTILSLGGLVAAGRRRRV
jgi:hypothetical protein